MSGMGAVPEMSHKNERNPSALDVGCKFEEDAANVCQLYFVLFLLLGLYLAPTNSRKYQRGVLESKLNASERQLSALFVQLSQDFVFLFFFAKHQSAMCFQPGYYEYEERGKSF